MNKRREWAARIVLEASSHSNTEWVTLTYSPQWLPTGGTLEPAHLQLLLRGLRQRLRRKYGYSVRFFGVGEYGSRTKRPHYHLFLFGLRSEHRAEVAELWKYGHVMWAHDPVNSKIAEYTAGYTVKKEGKDHEKLGGRHPEFSRMSLKPPIGAAWAEQFGESLASNQYAVESIGDAGDAPASVRIGGKMLPVGRTLRRYIRKGLGWELELPEEVKRSNEWVRSQLFVNDDIQAKRQKAREAGMLKAFSRSRIFPKQEKL